MLSWPEAEGTVSAGGPGKTSAGAVGSDAWPPQPTAPAPSAQSAAVVATLAVFAVLASSESARRPCMAVTLDEAASRRNAKKIRTGARAFSPLRLVDDARAPVIRGGHERRPARRPHRPDGGDWRAGRDHGRQLAHQRPAH